MAIPLANLLAHEALALRMVAPPIVPSTDVSIEWAHGIELVDPRPFLSGGEMVMLTGLRLAPSDAQQTAYVDRLVDARVAVLGFGTGVQYARIPDAVVARCRYHHLPLVEIPLHTPFMAVTREVARWEAAQRAAPLQELIDLQQVLSRAAVRGGVPELVRRAHTALGPLAVLDHRGAVIAAAAPDWFTEQASAWVLRRRPGAAAGTVVLRADAGGERARVEIHALAGRHAHRGWLAVATPEHLEVTDRLLVNQIASLAALSLDTGAHVVDETARESIEAAALAALLRRSPVDDEVLDLLYRAGVLSSGDVVAVVILTSGRRGAPRSLHRDLAAAGVDHLCRSAGGEILLVTPSIDDVSEHLASHRDEIVAVGVSAPSAVADIDSAVASARRAAAGGLRRDQWLVTASELESVIADPTVMASIRERAASIFEALDAADLRSDGDLIETLRVYLTHQGRWAAAAHELGVHRHTLTARIARIEHLAGIDLSDAHQCAVLLLACDTRHVPA